MTSNTWEVKFDSQRRLLGPYPKSIDLTQLQMPELDFSDPAKIVIADDSNLEELTISGDVTGVAFAEIGNLPALKALHVSCTETNPYYQSLQWINLQDLAGLTSLVIQGDVKALNIANAPLLRELDVNKCPSLELLTVEGNTSLALVRLEGCVKLRTVHGLAVGFVASLQAAAQITANQSGSRKDNLLYEGMTFTDVDLILESLNKGIKQASLKGVLLDWSRESSRYGEAARDPAFMPFGYRLLAPLEEIYTGGTGETYPFAAILTDGGDDLSEDIEEVGNLSVEKCLDYFLQRASQFEWALEGDEQMSEENVLAHLTSMAISST